MAIALRGSPTSGSNGGGVNSCTVAKPTGLASGDVALVFVTLDTSNSPTVTITGFTALAGPTGNSSNYKTQVFRRVCDAGDVGAGNFTVSLTANAAVIRADAIAYSGVDNTTPEDVATTIQQQAAGGNPTTTPAASSQTTVTAGAEIVYYAANRGTSNTGTAGGGATERTDSTDGNTVYAYIEDLAQGAAGAVALTMTSTSSVNFNVAQVALRPAAPSGSFTNTVPPSLSGSLNTGSTLTINTGTWSPTPGSFTYTWDRADDTAGTNLQRISTATGATYTLDPVDATKYIRAGVYPAV